MPEARTTRYAEGINPELLKWCRGVLHYREEDAAAYLKVGVEKIIAWEKGESVPTIKQAMKLGKLYHRPWAIFFLSKKPSFQVLQDFRSVASGETQTEYSPRLSIFLNEIREQKEWLSDYLKSSSEKENPFIGSWSNLGKPKDLARRIIDILEIDYSKIYSLTSRSAALKYYQSLAEKKLDIFVGKTTAERIAVDEMRGVFLHDKYAPMIFINSTDSTAAQIFTLFHEIAHAFIDEEGVSNLKPMSRDINGVDKIEVFCNRVASEVALPEELLLEHYNSVSGDYLNKIKEISIYFKVSEEMIGTKLVILGELTQEELDVIKRIARDAITGATPVSFGDYHRNRFSRNGALFTQTVLSAYKSGEIMILEAAKLLNIKTSHINKQMDYAFK